MQSAALLPAAGSRPEKDAAVPERVTLTPRRKAPDAKKRVRAEVLDIEAFYADPVCTD
jgi:hypothetical protein